MQFSFWKYTWVKSIHGAHAETQIAFKGVDRLSFSSGNCVEEGEKRLWQKEDVSHP